jgi:hypothetical protein
MGSATAGGAAASGRRGGGDGGGAPGGVGAAAGNAPPAAPSLDNMQPLLERLVCPISMEMMVDPVLCVDSGQTFERLPDQQRAPRHVPAGAQPRGARHARGPRQAAGAAVGAAVT